MSSVEAGNRHRPPKTLEDRLRADPVMNARIEKHLTRLRLEQQMIEAMDRQRVSSAERTARPKVLERASHDLS
jgi:hypothetical protein